ncbi:MAG: hypothetical protein EBV83_03045 [Verrucomicrobia bacterium]|nr:hypothetical protein [Verrucomicrobiota bacterium]
MKHGRNRAKLGRTSQHRDSMLANLVGSLIRHERVRTTVARAKAARPVAEKLVTLGKKGSLHHRRLAVAALHESLLEWVERPAPEPEPVKESGKDKDKAKSPKPTKAEKKK